MKERYLNIRDVYVAIDIGSFPVAADEYETENSKTTEIVFQLSFNLVTLRIEAV